MVIVAQLARAPDCGSGGRGFEPHLSPHLKTYVKNNLCFFYYLLGSNACVKQWLPQLVSIVAPGSESLRQQTEKPHLSPHLKTYVELSYVFYVRLFIMLVLTKYDLNNILNAIGDKLCIKKVLKQKI